MDVALHGDARDEDRLLARVLADAGGAVADAEAGVLPAAHRQLEGDVVELGVVDADDPGLDPAGDLLAGYVGRPLATITGYTVRRRRPYEGRERDVVRLAAIFQKLSPWLPMTGKCLVRSFVLRRFLQRSGVDADWVFGVRTWPFSAHCWLQLGDRALDDHAERLDASTPILVT